MNIKTKQIALPMIVVIAMLLAFSSPAAADYSGDHPLTTYEHGFVADGGLIFETETDNSTYTTLMTTPPGPLPLASMTQDITIAIPAGATVKTARLYNYVTWSKSDNGDKYVSGDPAEADLTFNGVTVTCKNPAAPIPNTIFYPNGAVQYWDTKGPDYDCGIKYDYPSGTFAWDVTNLVANGINVATIANNDSTPTPNEYFATFGFGLLVVYEGADGTDNELEYWIDEGCDVLLNTSKWGVNEPIATTNAMFPGCIKDVENKSADLTIVTMAPDKGIWSDWPASMNMNYFNGLTTADEIGPSIIDLSIPDEKPWPRTRTIGSSTLAGMWHGYNVYVSCQLQPCNNILYLQDRDLGTGRGDNTAVSNAFLVVTYPSIPAIPADVAIMPRTVNVKSTDEWITVQIVSLEGYDVEDIEEETVNLDCIFRDTALGDGIFKFNRSAVNAYLNESVTGSNVLVELTVTGQLSDGKTFEGCDTVRVIKPGQ